MAHKITPHPKTRNTPFSGAQACFSAISGAILEKAISHQKVCLKISLHTRWATEYLAYSDVYYAGFLCDCDSIWHYNFLQMALLSTTGAKTDQSLVPISQFSKTLLEEPN